MKSLNLNDYLKRLPLERQRKIESRAREIRAEELSLKELRKALRHSQQTIADILGVKQGEVSKMERRTDMFLSTVRRYIEAMGGRLDLVASFPGRKTVHIMELASMGFDEEEQSSIIRKRKRRENFATSTGKRARVLKKKIV